MNAGTTLITGASKGIGLHLAHEFAKHGHPLVLVAKDEDELGVAARDIEQNFQVPVRTIACDLGTSEGIEHLLRETENAPIEFLVNNAGVGHRGRVWEVPLEQHLEMIRVNIEAVVRLTHAILPRLIARGRGRILTTASVAGFEPGPTMATYHATKAFVLSWSESLATELEDTPITCTALCPGPTDTDFFVTADMMDTRAFQQANLMAPQDVAETGYKALMNAERVVVAGAINKAMVFGRRLMPESLQAAINKTMYEDVDPDDRKRERGDKERTRPDHGRH